VDRIGRLYASGGPDYLGALEPLTALGVVERLELDASGPPPKAVAVRGPSDDSPSLPKNLRRQVQAQHPRSRAQPAPARAPCEPRTKLEIRVGARRRTRVSPSTRGRRALLN
jgi:hypothetical protein